MRPDDVYVKTDKGREEIQTRNYKLPPSLRTLLIMTDGRTKAGELVRQTSSLGIAASSVDQLHADGFISLEQSGDAPKKETPAGEAKPESEHDRFSLAQRFMNESSVNAAGLKSFTFTLKLERSQSLEDLRSLLPDYTKLIEKGLGKIEAEVLIRKANDLLA